MERFFCVLKQWLENDLLAPKVIFVDHSQEGAQLLHAAARRGIRCLNTKAMTVKEYMLRCARPLLLKENIQIIDRNDLSVLLLEIMEQDEYRSIFETGGRVEQATAVRVADMLMELYENGVSPEALLQNGMDTLAGLMEKANERMQANGFLPVCPVPQGEAKVRYAYPSSLLVNAREQAFLQGLPEGSITPLPLPVPAQETYPRTALLQNAQGIPCPARNVTCIKAQDEGTEAAAALRWILEKGIPAEEVMILCADRDTAGRVMREAERLQVPCSGTFGRSLRDSGWVNVLRSLLLWAEHDFDSEQLAPVLLTGVMALQDENGNSVMYGMEILHALREFRLSQKPAFILGWGMERLQLFKSLVRETEQEERRNRYTALAELLLRWAGFFSSGEASAAWLAEQLCMLLPLSCLPFNEQSAVLNGATALAKNIGRRISGAEFVSMLISILENMNYSASTDQPGKVYITSPEKALFCERKYILMLGLDREVMDQPGREFPLLHDDVKQKLSRYLFLREDAGALRRYKLRELLLLRPDASFVFSYAAWDVPGGKMLLPSEIYEQYAARVGEEEALILERTPITDTDLYLQQGGRKETIVKETEPQRWQETVESYVFSPSGIEMLCNCPRRFAYGYLCNIRQEDPAPRDRETADWLMAVEKGNLVHDVLEACFASGNITREHLMDCFDREMEKYRLCIPVPPMAHPETEEASMRGMVLAVMEEYIESGRENLCNEMPFGEQEEPVRLTFGAHTILLRGKIDRVDLHNGEAVMIDYKTGNAQHFKEKIDEKLQWLLYARAWEATHPGEVVHEFSYYLLNPDSEQAEGFEKVQMHPDADEAVMAEEKIAAALEILHDEKRCMLGRMGEARLEKAEKGKKFNPEYDMPGCCSYCVYKQICIGEQVSEA